MAKNILITGAARRLGAECARYLHQRGYNLCIHYRTSEHAATELCDQLNQIRAGSCIAVQGDLLDIQAIPALVEEVFQQWSTLDGLVNNASAFYATEVQSVNETQWDELLGSNLKAPFFLVQHCLPKLTASHGCVVNIVDIHAEKGLKGYPVYSIAKAGLVAMTRSLAKELAPQIRVNAVAPGVVLWPEHEMDEAMKDEILQRVALQRSGSPSDIAKAVGFLIDDSPYITGQVLTVDGGRTLFY